MRFMAVTTNEVGDSPVAAELLSQIPNHEIVASFTGDGAYDTQDVHEVCHHRKAIPLFLHAKAQGGVEVWHSRIATKGSRRARSWVVLFGSAGAATAPDPWWRRR